MPAFLSVKLQITVRLNLGLIRRLSDSVFIVVDDFYLTDFDSLPPPPFSPATVAVQSRTPALVFECINNTDFKV